MGYSIGSIGLLNAVLSSLHSMLQSYIDGTSNPRNSHQNTSENSRNFLGEYTANELNARNWLIRELNSGRKIAIGRRVYSHKRRELGYVWDGRLKAKQFDWSKDAYCGPHRQFVEIRVLERSDCPVEWRSQFDHVRNQGTGRPRAPGLQTAIERVARRDPRFDEPAYFKQAVYQVQCELGEMHNSGEITQLPKRRTIEEAIRRRRSNSN